MIPQNQNEKEVLSRLQKVESEVFHGETFETNYGKLSPREQSKRSSEGKDEPHHIGTKTKEVLAQEWKSILNEYNPETMTDEETKDWNNQHKEIWDDSMSLPERDWNWIINNVGQFRDRLVILRKYWVNM